MYLSLHNEGICITLPVACNDHDITLIWDEWRDGKGYTLGGAYCPDCGGTYYPVQDEFHHPFIILESNSVSCLYDDMGGY